MGPVIFFVDGRRNVSFFFFLFCLFVSCRYICLVLTVPEAIPFLRVHTPEGDTKCCNISSAEQWCSRCFFCFFRGRGWGGGPVLFVQKPQLLPKRTHYLAGLCSFLERHPAETVEF